MGPATEGDFMRLYRDFYQKYGEYKWLLWNLWETLYTTFLITSTSDNINKSPMGNDGGIIESNTTDKRCLETQYLGPMKIENIENSQSEHEEEKQRWEKTRKELTLVAEKATQFCNIYVGNHEYVKTEMSSLNKDQKCFLHDLLPPLFQFQRLHKYSEMKAMAN